MFDRSFANHAPLPLFLTNTEKILKIRRNTKTAKMTDSLFFKFIFYQSKSCTWLERSRCSLRHTVKNDSSLSTAVPAAFLLLGGNHHHLSASSFNLSLLLLDVQLQILSLGFLIQKMRI